MPVFVAQFTSSPLLIGAPAALRLGGLFLPQLPTAVFIRRFQHIKNFLMWQAVIGRLALIACVPAALWANALSPELVLGIVLVAFAVFSFTEGAATLAWLDMLGEIIHARLRGRFFGFIQLLGGIGSIGAGFAVQRLLADDVAPPAFVPLFGWGCVAFMLSALCIGLCHEPRDVPRKVVDEPTLRHVASLLRGGHLVRLGLAQVLAGSLQMALPFYVLFGRDRLGLSGDWLGSFVIAQIAGASIAGLGWARLAERYGARLVIVLSAVLLIPLPLIAGASEYVGGGIVLLSVYALGGAANGGSRVGFWQYVLDLVPAHDRRMFMGLANTANAPSLLMPLVGGALLDWGGFGWLLGGSVVGGVGATLAALWLARRLS